MSKSTYRYHRQLFFPEWSYQRLADFFFGEKEKGVVTFSIHSINKLLDATNKYGINLWNKIQSLIKSGEFFSVENVFEFYSDEADIKKVCMRFSFVELPTDLIFVLSKNFVVITIYLTSKDDSHSNLNKSLYDRS